MCLTESMAIVEELVNAIYVLNKMYLVTLLTLLNSSITNAFRSTRKFLTGEALLVLTLSVLPAVNMRKIDYIVI
jgi:uncharacterized membrane protein YcaP (DUF421 family)